MAKQDETIFANAIYVSPHRDDVCFSLGGSIPLAPGGSLINVFTRSMFAPDGGEMPPDLKARIAVVTGIRDLEDQEFSQMSNLTRYELPFAEPAVRGCKPFSCIEERDLSVIWAELVQLIEYVLEQIGDDGAASANLFCPLGVGGHIDHLAIVQCFASHYRRLRSQAQIHFYEEFPYAGNPSACQRAALQMNDLPEFRAYKRHVMRLPESAVWTKKERISCYQSQTSVFPPETVEKFEYIWSR